MLDKERDTTQKLESEIAGLKAGKQIVKDEAFKYEEEKGLLLSTIKQLKEKIKQQNAEIKRQSDYYRKLEEMINPVSIFL